MSLFLQMRVLRGIISYPLTQYPQEFARSKTAITSPELTPPVGPFSQAIEVGGFLYISGQVMQVGVEF
jgi:enamine deaminase RidA (YjgF/YER057c/UK114 family)